MSYSKLLAYVVAILIICGLTFFSLNTTSCTKTVTEVIHDTTVVYDTTEQNFFYCVLYSSFSRACLYSDPIADPDSVNVKKEWDSDSIIFPIKLIYPDRLQLEDVTSHTICTTYTIKVTSNLGNAEGSIVVPEGTSITQPSQDDTLPIGEVTVLWTEAQGADFYWIDGFMIAYDSLGNGIELTDIRTYQTAASFVMPDSFFNEENAIYYYVLLCIRPYSGPVPVSGSTGNMTGALNGFLNGIGSEEQIWFYVGIPIKIAKQYHKKKEISIDDRIDAYLHAIGIR